MDTPATTNIPEYAVSDLAGAIRRTLEGAFGRVRVRGEITEMKRYPSGHVYLSLKDADAKIEAVIWKSAVRNLGTLPENGVEMIATGRISTYADRSKYQLVIERLEYAGEGALLARIEALRKRLLEEGLFDEARKKPIPRLPTVIGVVTSEKGAVIQDIRTTIGLAVRDIARVGIAILARPSRSLPDKSGHHGQRQRGSHAFRQDHPSHASNLQENLPSLRNRLWPVRGRLQPF